MEDDNLNEPDAPPTEQQFRDFAMRLIRVPKADIGRDAKARVERRPKPPLKPEP